MAALESTPTPIGLKRKLNISGSAASPSTPATRDQAAKRRKSSRNSSAGTVNSDANNDCYCWICHKEGEVICCETCPRVFHIKCIQLETAPTEDWVCPECVLIMTAENMDTRSRAMRLLSVDQLCILLKHALGRMRTVSGVDPFTKPVDPVDFPSYKEYITCPMDLSSVERNIKKKQYGSTEAFLADTKWILHNCIIFNSTSSKLTSIAKSLVKICKHEMQEIENCPDCYLNAHTRKDSWFVAACRIPHLLVWAKLKGFPFWPGKAMRVNSEENVGVRFFGAHDRAWIPVKDVFLYSLDAPVLMRNKKKGNLDGCVHEVELYIKNITDKFGKFEYAPPKINIDPKKEEEQIKILYPKCTLPFELGPMRRRTRTYSLSGSERSVSATPTPSDLDDTMDALKEDETVIEEKEDEVPPMLTDAFVGKEIVDDEVMGTSEEDLIKDTSITTEIIKETPVKKQTKTPKQDKKSQKDAKNASETTKVNDNDRAAESPPCEVSSTTVMDTEKSSKADSSIAAENVEIEKSTEKTTSDVEKPTEPADVEQTAVVSETSEVVTVVGPASVTDEIDDIEEIDDVEPDDEEEEDASEPVVEPVVESVPEPVPLEVETEVAAESIEAEAEEEPQEGPADVEDEAMASVEETPAKPQVAEPETPKPIEAPSENPVEEKAPDEEEIDDDEPMETDDEIVEEIADDEDEVVEPQIQEPAGSQEVDTSRLLAAGVSVTIVEKSGKQKSGEENKTSNSKTTAAKETLSKSPMPTTEIGLGSDISVTLVQKKKSDVPASTSEQDKDTPTVARKATISVKKESELLQDPSAAKDVVQVSNILSSANKNRKTFPSKSVDAAESPMAALAAVASNKTQPDPIVTISKVNSTPAPKETSASPLSQLQQGSSRTNAQAPAARPAVIMPPAVSSPMNVPVSSPMARTTIPPVSTMGSLASILGAPRMSGPTFRPGVQQPPTPHGLRPGSSSSPLMRMAGPVGPRGPPMQPSSSHGLPSLHPRPTGPLSYPAPQVPSGAGPVTEQLNKVAGKLVDYMRCTLEDLFRELANQGSPEAMVKALQLEMEKMQWRHQQELAEIKHNMDIMLMEVRQSMEADKQKTLADLKKQFDLEKQKLVAETKKKQWCAHCGKEAIFYCCWNTSYCDYPCQQAHWPSHMGSCAQNQSNQDDDGASNSLDNNHMDVMEHTNAGHFLGQVQKMANQRNQVNGMMESRGIPGGPSVMPFGPQHGMNINPRMMNQLGMRYAAAVAQSAAQPHQRFPGQIRFPGSYFM